MPSLTAWQQVVLGCLRSHFHPTPPHAHPRARRHAHLLWHWAAASCTPLAPLLFTCVSSPGVLCTADAQRAAPVASSARSAGVPVSTRAAQSASTHRQRPAHRSDHPSRAAGAPAALAARTGRGTSRPSSWACSGSSIGVLWLPPPMPRCTLALAVCDELSGSVCCVLCVAGGGFLRAVQPAYDLLGQHGQYGLHGWAWGRRARARLRHVLISTVRTGRVKCPSRPVGRRCVCRFAGRCGSCTAGCSSSILLRCVDLLGMSCGARSGP